MTNNKIIKSVLKRVRNVYNISTNKMEKGFRLFQKQIDEKGLCILKENLHKKFISQRIYITTSLLKHSRDAKKLNYALELSDEGLYHYLRSRNHSIVNIDSVSDDKDTKRFVLFPYGGGKQNHKSTQQSIIESMLIKNKDTYKSYYEPFLGGGGSFYNSLPLLLENNINNIYLSDINKSLINTFRQVQRNHKQVQRHLAEIDIAHLREFGTLHPQTKEDAKRWFQKIHKRFTEIEIKNRMNPERASLFLYLIHNCQGGMLTFNIKSNINTFSFCYCPRKVTKVPALINKVEIYNKILNITNIKFSVKRYETVDRQIKNDSTALVLFDPPYVKYEETTTSKDFTNCKYNYGINDFNHRRLLNKIKNSKYSFVYYNNHNPHLEKYSKKQKFDYLRKDVVYQNGSVGTKSVEILMFKDKVPTQNKFKTIYSFKPLEIRNVA